MKKIINISKIALLILFILDNYTIIVLKQNLTTNDVFCALGGLIFVCYMDIMEKLEKK